MFFFPLLRFLNELLLKQYLVRHVADQENVYFTRRVVLSDAKTSTFNRRELVLQLQAAALSFNTAPNSRLVVLVVTLTQNMEGLG